MTESSHRPSHLHVRACRPCSVSRSLSRSSDSLLVFQLRDLLKSSPHIQVKRRFACLPLTSGQTKQKESDTEGESSGISEDAASELPCWQEVLHERHLEC